MLALSKKSMGKFISHVLILIIEKDIKEFKVEDFWNIGAKYTIYDKWEQKRSIQVLEQLGIVQNRGGNFVVIISSADAINLLKNYEEKKDDKNGA